MPKIQFFADIDNITNKRGTDELIVKLISQEINDEQAGVVMALRNKYVAVLLSTNEVTEEDAIALPDEFEIAPAIDQKSASQRLRGVLYRQWESRYKTRYPDSEKYYAYRMEQIIDEEKGRI